MIPFDLKKYPYPTKRECVFGKRGMVATSHPLATEAGMAILRRGGNAIDAAVAAAAALSVVEPGATGPGGDLFAILWAGGKLYGLNASGHSAARFTLDELKRRGVEKMPETGWLTTTVSGGPGGWAALSTRFGRLGMEETFAPAVELAEETVASEGYAAGVNNYMKKLGEANDPIFQPWLEQFAPGRKELRAGQAVRMPDLARSLSRIAQTRGEDFYRGGIAKAIAAHSKKTGGLLDYDDFASYYPQWVEPVSINYKGYDIWELPPNGQGIVPIMALNIMKGLPAYTHDDAQSVHNQLESIKLAFADAFAYIADPLSVPVGVDALLSEAYAQKRRALVGERAAAPGPGEPHNGGTVYLCAADGEGNMISLIQSVASTFGSGVVVPGTGILLQNRGAGFVLDPSHPNCAGPRKRSFHTIIPGFVTKNGQPVGPMGVMGGHMQPQGHMQVVMNMIDFGMNPQAALDAPRWLWQRGNTVAFEAAWPAHVLEALQARGHVLSQGGYFGRGQIIIRMENGALCGGTEGRSGGAILAY